MDKKVVSFNEIKKQKFIEELPEEFDITDTIEFANKIEYSLNSLFEFALNNKDYRGVCQDEQTKILINIVSSYFKIFFDEVEVFMETGENGRTLYNFCAELYKITNSLPKIEEFEKSKVLEFKNDNNK